MAFVFPKKISLYGELKNSFNINTENRNWHKSPTTKEKRCISPFSPNSDKHLISPYQMEW